MTKTETTWRAYYHRDGSKPQMLHEGMTRDQARQWIDGMAAQCGQPVLLGGIVNESGVVGCGYYAIDPTEAD